MNVLFKRKKWAMISFMAPTVIIFALIMVIPLIQSCIMSFTEWDGVNAAVFNGLANYRKLLRTRDLAMAIRNSVLFSLILVVYQVGLGTLIAYLLTSFEYKINHFFKNVYFFPVLLSSTVVAQLFISIYHGDYGLINQFAKLLGSSWTQNWLNEDLKGITAVAMSEAWKGMAYHMLIIYAAMRNVPASYYEASRIDGATRVQQFFRITLPLTLPTIKVSVVLCITYGFRSFEMIYLMTGGGPGNYTTSMPIMMYEALFRLNKYGYGSAIATVIVVVCVSIMKGIDFLTARFED